MDTFNQQLTIVLPLSKWSPKLFIPVLLGNAKTGFVCLVIYSSDISSYYITYRPQPWWKLKFTQIDVFRLLDTMSVDLLTLTQIQTGTNRQ